MSAHAGPVLLKRIAYEHRRVLIPLAAVLVVNVLVYAFIVYPMASRVANIEESSRAAQADLRAAQRDFEQANGTLVGKDRAAQELTTFYTTVLPRGVAGARRLTTLRLYQFARDADLDVGRQALEDVVTADSTLKHLKAQMDLAGSYDDMRAFIHQLEIAPEFVIVDNVTLAEGADEGTLVVNVELSTYYREPTATPTVGRAAGAAAPEPAR
jgi:Tfp pilus assembly protein PilO